MTIATRNRFIKLAAAVSCILILASVAALVIILSRGNLPKIPHGVRPVPFLVHFFLTPYEPLPALLSVALFPLLSLAGLLYTLFAFEKTQTTEITFFAACTFVISLEALRLAIPLYQLWDHSAMLPVTISRAVLFARIFFVLSLLASILLGSNKTTQQSGPALFLLGFLAFSLTNAIPVNSANPGSNFIITTVYPEMMSLFFVLIASLAALSYLVHGITHGTPEYIGAAGGAICFSAGYLTLTVCDSWLFLAAGTALTLLGARNYLAQMHRYYLWQ